MSATPCDADDKQPTAMIAEQGIAPSWLTDAIQGACARVAPSWPLDRSIAVNPWWGFIDQPIEKAAALLERLSATRCTMEADWFRQQYASGAITDAALSLALQARAMPELAAAFIQDETLAAFAPTMPDDAAVAARSLITRMLDGRSGARREPSWSSVVRHAIGQHCAMWFDRGQARWQAPASESMYASWRALASHDDAPSMLTGRAGISARVAMLPASADDLMKAACGHLKIGPENCGDYFTALLLDVSGWAGWCAYLRFKARQAAGEDNSIEDLLAIRLAWEWVLSDVAADAAPTQQRAKPPAQDDPVRLSAGGNSRWIWQEAMERTWQHTINLGLAVGANSGRSAAGDSASAALATRPALQAAFCIDVRSEPLRRALEACDPSIRTHGFAGFFGLPIEFQSLASREAQPRLPGPLRASLKVVQRADSPESTDRLATRRRARLGRIQAWQGFRTAGSGGFGFVETLGLGYAWKLLKASLPATGKGADADMPGLSPSEADQLHPAFDALPPDAAVDLAAGVLGAMSLQAASLAPIVLLVGHGSESANNPHAHGLDCGACCGQSGQINARTLAALLNDADVREGLAGKGIAVPEDTRFIGALHNTTTDDIRLYDTTASGQHMRPALRQVRQWLDDAADATRRERAPSLGLAATAPAKLAASLRKRAADWSQVRPEWGLANNAGFIAAPRGRSRHLNLAGRVFLHDYDHAADTDHAVLTLILTAPVVVAHWISMQYYASAVDNAKWGCGNKVLHNVVGGDIGVFEGNGGDLRIGLPMQSLHDGTQWMHTPMRLSVWVEAPPEAIGRVVAEQVTVRNLVHGAWIHLFCIEPDSGRILRYQTPHQAALKATGAPGTGARWVEELASGPA